LSGNEPLQPEFWRLKVCVWPVSGSVAVNEPMVVFEDWFSSMSLFESEMSVGASLTSLTEIVKTFSKVSEPLSVYCTRIE
jgi:hypothetical protein